MLSAIKALFGLGKHSKWSAAKRAKPTRKPKGFVAGITAMGDRMAFAWPVRESLYRHMSAQVGNGITVEVALDTFRVRLQRR